MPHAFCPHCRESVIYARRDANAETVCPSCEQPFILPEPPPSNIGNYSKKFLIGMGIVVGLIIFAIIFAGGVMLLSSDFAAEALGSLFGVLLYGGIALLVIITAILWLFFPVFSYFYLKRIAIATEASQHFLEALLMKKD